MSGRTRGGGHKAGRTELWRWSSLVPRGGAMRSFLLALVVLFLGRERVQKGLYVLSSHVIC